MKSLFFADGKPATVNIDDWTPHDLKADVEAVFHHLGLTTTEAIKLFFRQVKLRGGLPFPVEIPNAETIP